MTQNKQEPTQKSAAAPTHQRVSPLTALVDDDENTQMHHSAALGRDKDFDKSMAGRVNVENYLGWTPLMMACRNGHLSTVKVLLGLSADATRKNKFGTSTFLISVSSGITPLMFASAMEDCPAFTMLAKSKADPGAKNWLGSLAADIRLSRRQKRSAPAPPKEPPTVKPPPPLTPAELISMSPHMNALRPPMPPPLYCLGPQSPFYVLSPGLLQLRKSSNAHTPSPNIIIATPNVTPIAPMGCHPQVFFPPEFGGGAACCGQLQCSPMPAGEFLNARLEQGVFLSPNLVGDGRAPSYCA